MIKVIKISDLIKYIIKIIIPLAIIFIILNIFKFKNEVIKSSKQHKPLFFCLDESITELKVVNLKIKTKQSIYERILSSEFNILENNLENRKIIANKNDENNFAKQLQTNSNSPNNDTQFNKIDNDEKKEKEADNIDNSNNNFDDESKSKDAIKNIEEIIAERPELNAKSEPLSNSTNSKYTNEYNGVKIDNATNYNLTDEMLNYEKFQINSDKIIIYHTHTCESYTQTEANRYEESGNYRTTNLNFSVSRVGDELEKELKLYGSNIIHDKTYHDYPAYNGSYSRSLQTVERIIDSNKDAEIVIDLHRDAIADSSYAPKVKIGNEYVSQLMFVIGSNAANSIHSNWNENLKFAIKVQQKANEIYPGLFKPIILRNSEYNQHVAKGACIIEVGATGNTLEESMASMKYLARIIEQISH